MPNPLRRKVKYLLEPLKLLERPNLAAHVAVIASLWTKVEIELGKLIIFVSGNPKEGAATFNALKSAGSRGDVIRAIAQLRLDKDEIKQLEDLLKEYRRIAGERNDIIHNLWGISDDMPEALLRVNAEEIISNLAHVVNALGSSANKGASEALTALFMGSRAKIGRSAVMLLLHSVRCRFATLPRASTPT